MDLGESPKIFPNLGIFVIEIPKNRNFGIFLDFGGIRFRDMGIKRKALKPR